MANQIFLFYGEEGFLIQQKIDELKKNIPNPTLNIEQFDGENTTPENIFSALQITPLLGGRKLVIVKHVNLKLPHWDRLVPVLKGIAGEVGVVFWVSIISKKSKLLKFIEERGEVYEFRTFAEWEGPQVISWIKKEVNSLGKQISQPAIVKLHEICGNDLHKLSSEIDKLITYIGERQSIALEDVVALASPGEINVFALSNALAEKKIKKSLSAFRILYKNKTELFGVLSLLANQYRVMLFAKNLPPFEKNPHQIASRIGVSPYFVRKCLARMANFSEDELKKNLELLLETDLKLKSGEQLLATLELLITSLCFSKKL